MSRKDFRAVRDKFARDGGLPFGRLLGREYVLHVLASEGHQYRNRVFCPLTTLWGWLSQSLSQDKSLNEAVSRVLANRAATGLPSCSASSAAYAKARTRFPESVMVRMAKEIGRKVHLSADDRWHWRGRRVLLADGTGFSMPDTPENQLAYPQVKNVAPGLGFPLMRAVALISLATGAVVDIAFAKHEGKGTGESSLLRRMMPSMDAGDIMVADAYYPSYFTAAMLGQRGVDIVSLAHNSRDIDFSTGEQLGPNDHIVAWPKSKRPKWMDKATYDALPDTVFMREFEIPMTGKDGKPTTGIVVSSITDPAISKDELSALYWTRWNVELDFRSIKCALHMDVLRAKSPSMVHKEIWCHVLAYNLLRGTMVESAKRNDILPRQISVKGAMQAVESFTPAMMAASGVDAIYAAFLQTVAAHRVGNRPGRMEPRFKKRRPQWREYMTIPRRLSKRRLASQAAKRLS
jgi:hypothetical protein